MKIDKEASRRFNADVLIAPYIFCDVVAVDKANILSPIRVRVRVRCCYTHPVRVLIFSTA